MTDFESGKSDFTLLNTSLKHPWVNVLPYYCRKAQKEKIRALSN